MAGILLDTHALYWLARGEVGMTEQSLAAIVESQVAKTLFVSPISAWELSVASQKNHVAGRPHLGDIPPDRWFRAAVRAAGARIIPIGQRISLEAANVVAKTAHRDPGDCFLIATARVKRLPIVTRDGTRRSIAAEQPDYLSVIEC